jgi:hypothetical protein
MNNDLNQSRKSFYEFVAQNKELFATIVFEMGVDSDEGIYEIQLQIPESFYTNNNRPLYERLSIAFKVDFAQLSLAYKELIVPEGQVKVEYDLSTTEGTFDFIEREWHNIIMHLGAFNQQQDNYDEIAKLVQKNRGGFVGAKFGI